ncbi:MAG: type II toxin-antitoxin system RelE/ParE family toxin [Ignavibacteriae bacterium]|nr:type II toxin-antitoxin system RelE/ParE family toxin [Ignavibacteriota bacterium]
MTLDYQKTFSKDLLRIKDRTLLQRVKETILDVERAHQLDEIPHLKKLAPSKDAYRIRVGDYRIGITISGNIVSFVRFLHRKEIYRHFPL